MQMKDTMVRYYDKRSPVYDRVYAYPERQIELRLLEDQVATFFAGRNVLEVAAGTGYWTQFIATQANAVVATDVNQTTLDVLSDRDISGEVRTLVSDAYDLSGVQGEFDAAFAGCWISHVPIEDQRKWFTRLHAKLAPGARVFLLDNSSEQCARLPIVATDDHGNTYQERVTDDGATHKVLKNFPTAQALIDLVGADNMQFDQLTHYWTFSYRVKE